MTNIPHDQYLEYLDAKVYSDILEFHKLTNYTIHNSSAATARLHYLEEDTISRLSGNQLEISPCSKRSFLKLSPLDDEHPMMRNESIEYFHQNALSFTSIVELLRPLVVRG